MRSLQILAWFRTGLHTVLALMALGLLDTAVVTYNLQVRNEILLTQLSLGLPHQRNSVPDRSGDTEAGYHSLGCDTATVVALHQERTEL